MHLQLPNQASTTYKINIERKFTMYRTKDLVVSYSHNIIIALVHGKADCSWIAIVDIIDDEYSWPHESLQVCYPAW